MPKTSAHYDTYDYPSYWKGRDYEHESEVIVLKSFLGRIKSLGKIADVGGGFGRLVPYYQSKAVEVVIAEPSQSLLDVAKAAHRKNAKVKYLQTTVEDLSKKIKPGSLDSILMVRVMHHMGNPTEVIKTFSKLLKKDGTLILEFANKIHGKALFENICKGDFTFPIDLTPSDRRCAENQQEEVISFYNYHPETILCALQDEGFKVKAIRSVSNVRNGKIKKYLPFPLLLSLEKLLQKPLSRVYFGPSIFILAQKHHG